MMATIHKFHFGDTATNFEGEDWEINLGDMGMSLKELITIREKYEIPSFVGMRTNLEGYRRAQPP